MSQGDRLSDGETVHMGVLGTLTRELDHEYLPLVELSQEVACSAVSYVCIKLRNPSIACLPLVLQTDPGGQYPGLQHPGHADNQDHRHGQGEPMPGHSLKQPISEARAMTRACDGRLCVPFGCRVYLPGA